MYRNLIGRLKIIVCVVFLFSSLPCFAKTALADGSDKKLTINVVASIRPLALLVDELLGDALRQTFKTQTLLQNQESPHHFSLSISQAKKLADADLLLWVGPEFELFLHKAARSSRSVAFVDAQDSDEHNHHHNDHAHNSELHLWLDIVAIETVSKQLVTELKKLSPKDAPDLDVRLEEFLKEVALLDSDLKRQLLPFTQQGFLVFHDGYGPLVHRYGLNQVASITRVPDEQVSARRLGLLQQQIKTYNVQCLIVDENERMQAQRYANVLGLKVSSVDLLAARAGNQQSYTYYMKQIAYDFVSCFAQI